MTGERTTLAEVAAVLARFGGLACAPAIDADVEHGVALTVAVGDVEQDDSAAALATHALREELRYLVGVAQVRAFARAYGIRPAALAAFVGDERPAPVDKPFDQVRVPHLDRPFTADDVGSAVREFDAIVADALERQRRGDSASGALDALYSRLRVYFGDVNA